MEELAVGTAWRSLDVVEEAASFRTAFRDWVEDYAATRRRALQTGQVVLPPEGDLRRWSRCYFNHRLDEGAPAAAR
jgi:hypothetical protein